MKRTIFMFAVFVFASAVFAAEEPVTAAQVSDLKACLWGKIPCELRMEDASKNFGNPVGDVMVGKARYRMLGMEGGKVLWIYRYIDDGIPDVAFQSRADGVPDAWRERQFGRMSNLPVTVARTNRARAIVDAIYRAAFHVAEKEGGGSR